MNIKSTRFTDGRNGSALAVRVQPRAKKNQIKELLEDGTVKIGITAAPVQGQANTALIKFLADILEIPQTRIEIVAGSLGKNKLVSIYDLDAEVVQTRLMAAMHK
jgi:hypothetical protein